MARRLFLHVGTPKTGTSYLQSVLWANKEALGHGGLLLPLGSVREHFYLSSVARDASRARAAMPRAGQTAWRRMLEQLGTWDGDALISHELFAATTPERVAWTRQQLAPVVDEVHVVVTARDFARQVPAEWQQSVKHGRTHGLREYCERLEATDPDRSGGATGSAFFWRAQHLPRILEKWAPDGQPSHLVTVPPRSAPKGQLWARFASVIGVGDTPVDQSVTVPNESLGVDEVETLRRVNQLIPEDLPPPRIQLLVKQILAETVLAGREAMRRIETPADLHAWMVTRGTAMTDDLRRVSTDVVGDLDELLPDDAPSPGTLPDDVDITRVSAVAIETIAELLFDRHELTVQRFVDEQHALRAELETRARRVDELQSLLLAERGTLSWERRHPVRAQIRGVVRVIRRARPAAPGDTAS